VVNQWATWATEVAIWSNDGRDWLC
jgi:hypothetical protein